MTEKKRTGGGMFDPGEAVTYFAAGNMFNERSCVAVVRHSLVATNDLFSKEGMRDVENRLAAPENCLLLDSGIFWLTNQHKRENPGMTMDEALALPPDALKGFGKLWDTYTGLIDMYEDRLWGYIELDQGGAENKRITRAKLEALGYRPIPVYHPLNDGWDYFDELCQQYDRICVGNVVQANAHVRRNIFHTMWERHRQYPDVWIHMLGVTPNLMCTVYPPNSADSATYCYSLVYGAETTPFATSMNHTFSKLDATYSYLPNENLSHPGAAESAVRFLVTHASLMQQNWRNQQADLQRIFEHPFLPPIDERERALVR